MHAEAKTFVSQFSTSNPITVIEIGSRYINGTIRTEFPGAVWTGLDMRPGRCVDWVGNALDYIPESLVDLVICCEVFEHTDQWSEIIAHAEKWIQPGGRFIITCAGPGRKPHSAIDGGKVRAGEHYANITAAEMRPVIESAGLRVEICHEVKTDLQVFARKSEQNIW